MIIFKKSNAFSLIELMVIILIFTVLLAAFAPVMTKKKTFDRDQPWRWQNSGVGAYFGAADANKISIGAKEAKGTFSIASKNNYPHLSIIEADQYVRAFFQLKNSNNYVVNNSLTTNLTGENNTAFGQQAFVYPKSASNNTALGSGTLLENLDGSNNTALGFATLAFAEASNNVGVGFQSLAYSDGDNNTAIGSYALMENVGGINNTAIGNTAMYHNTAGNDNVAIGQASMGNFNSGDGNTGVGFATFVLGEEYKYNTVVGRAAYNRITTANYNTALGVNIGIGQDDDDDSEEIDTSIKTTGHYNAGIGAYSLNHIDSGAKNTALGQRALVGLTSGNSNSAVGHNAGQYAVSASNHSFVGFDAAAGAGNISSTSQNIYLGSSGLDDLMTYSVEEITPYSDKRLKNIKGEYKNGIEQIRGITPKYFSFKADKNKQKKIGVIAQDVQKTLPEAVSTDENGYLNFHQEHIMYSLVNAVKELDKFVQNLISGVKSLIAKVFNLDKHVVAVEKDTDTINADIQKINERLKELEADD